MPPPKPSPTPTPAKPRKRLPQFSIFGLMVLMFVVSIGFSQAYYWTRAEKGWARRDEQRKAAAELAAQDPSASTAKPGEVKPAGAPLTEHRDESASDAPIAILMAVALPMLLMTIFSIGYSIRNAFRRKKRRA